MPEDDDDHGDNRPADMVLDAKLLKMGEEYVASLHRSSNENTIRTNIRENAGKLGVPSLAWQHSLMQARTMDKGELADYQRGLKRMKRVLDPVVVDLFPEDIARQEKRRSRAKEKATKAAAKAAEAKAKSIEAGDDNPRNDPKSGGAGKGRKKAEKPAAPAPAGDAKPWPDDTAAALAKAPPSDATHAALESSEAAINAEQEQIAGAEILDHKFGLTGKSGMGSVSDEKPLSQSEQAAEARAKAGL